MFRIDNAKTAPSLPAAQPVGPKPNGYFAKGTIVTSDFLNAIQEEICYLITQAGLDLDKNDSAQLFHAIQILAEFGPTGSGINSFFEDKSPVLGGDLNVGDFKILPSSYSPTALTGATDLVLDAQNIYIASKINFIWFLENNIFFGYAYIGGEHVGLDANLDGVTFTSLSTYENPVRPRITTCYNDPTMSADSDTALTTQAAFKAYADTNLTGLITNGCIITTCILCKVAPGGSATWPAQWGTNVNLTGATQDTPMGGRFACTTNGVIKNFYGHIVCDVTSGASTSLTSGLTLTVLLNDDTTTALTYTIAPGTAKGAAVSFSLTGVNINVIKGDQIQIKILTPGTSGGGGERYAGVVSLEYLKY